MQEVYNYPISRMAIEKKVVVNGLPQRADVIVFDRNGKPWLIAECKAPSVKMSEDTFLQAARYNMSLQVPFLVLTNGLEHVCLRQSAGEFVFMESLPEIAAD